ncbi:MAG: class I SAM-dependent methyltransferase [Spirochaetes bacterium]|nr:class I SAM-dependent methyltransferase [Spirochaetota bacterium]
MLPSFKPLIYRALIDPLLAGLRRGVLEYVEPSSRVLDVACGPGALALTMARTAGRVTGIDLSPENIESARRAARRRGTDNVRFEIRDAVDLSCYHDRQFDVAVASMAVHQFEAGLALQILAEMKRVARRIIIADYNHHMPGGWRRQLAWSIERVAGGDHFGNFRAFMSLGGIRHFTLQAGITIQAEAVRGGGVFSVAIGEPLEP